MDSSHNIAVRHSVNEFRSSSYRSGDAFMGAVNINSSSITGSSGGGVAIVASGGIGGSGSSSSGPSGATSSSSSATTNNIEIPHSPTPPLQRRLAKSFSVAPSNTQSKGAYNLYYYYFLF